MDRCALFVDASYALADGAMAVHGTRRRDSVSWNHAGLLTLLAGLAKDRTGLPVLRCYWYEAGADGSRTPEQDALAEMPGLKLRQVNVRPGRREGIETPLRRDLVTLAKNGAISDAFIASADEHLAEIVTEVQDLGLRVVILHISADGGWTIPQPLRQECDDIVEISGVHLRPFVELVRGAEPAGANELAPPAAIGSHGYASAGSLMGAAVGQGPAVGALPALAGAYSSADAYRSGAAPQGDPHAASGHAGQPSVGYQGPPGPMAAEQGSPYAGAADVMPAQAAPVHSGAVQAGPVQAGPGQAGPVQAGPGQAGPGQAGPGQAGPGQAGMSQADPGMTGSAQASAQGIVAGGYDGASAGPGEQARPPAHGHSVPPGGYSQAGVVPGRSSGGYLNGIAQGGYGYPDGAHYGSAMTGAADAGSGSGQNGISRADHHAAPIQNGTPVHNGVAHQGMPPDGRGRIDNGEAPAGGPQDLGAQAVGPLGEPGRGGIGSYGGPPAGHHAGPGHAQAFQNGSAPPGPAHAGMPQNGVYQLGPAQHAAEYQNGQQPGPVQAGPVQAGSVQPGPVQPGQVLPGSVLPGSDGRPGVGPAGYDAGPAAAHRYNSGEPGWTPGQGGYAGSDPRSRAPVMPGGQQGTGPAGPMQAASMQAVSMPAGAMQAGAAQAGSMYPAPAPNAVAPNAGLPGQVPLAATAFGSQQGPYAAQPPPARAMQPVAVSLPEAVQAAHAEGLRFGESIGRDAPGLWLDAVLARKPRMPSDLEARLLQGSALPIDSLLHDEVRHSLRRGFWDALESARR